MQSDCRHGVNNQTWIQTETTSGLATSVYACIAQEVLGQEGPAKARGKSGAFLRNGELSHISPTPDAFLDGSDEVVHQWARSLLSKGGGPRRRNTAEPRVLFFAERIELCVLANVLICSYGHGR